MSTSDNDKTKLADHSELNQKGSSEGNSDKTRLVDDSSAYTDETVIAGIDQDSEDRTTLVDIPEVSARTDQIPDENDKTIIVDTRPSITGSHQTGSFQHNQSSQFNNQQQPNPAEQQRYSSNRLINNRFELQTVLGAGGMGAVYKAIDLRKVEARDRNPYVALKLLNDDFKKHPDAFISLQRESRKSQNLAHPNIVTVYDFDRDGETVFMTMEFMEGSALDGLIRKNANIGLEFEKACRVFRDISEALAYAHSKNIIHSDFKPGNIFVLNSGHAKVFDFGIARAVSSSGIGAPTDDDKTVFDAGELSALTPAYASYEMLKGEEPSVSDDVYALACVAYELFAGKHPFNKTPADKAAEQNLKPKRIKNLKSRQWKALEKALQFKRSDRTATVKELEIAFFRKSRIPLYAAASILVAASASFIVYQQSQQVDEQVLREELEQELQSDIRANVEHELAVKSASNLLQSALKMPLDENWDAAVEGALNAYKKLAPDDTDTIIQTQQKAMSLYLLASAEKREAGILKAARELLNKASYWQKEDTEQIVRQESLLADAQEDLRQQQEQQKLAAEAEARRLAEAQRQQQIELARQEELRKQALARKKKQRDIANAEKSVQDSLYCSSSIDIGAIASTLSALQQLSANKYQVQKESAERSLSGCLTQIARRSPSTASRLKSSALKAFPQSPTIAAVSIDFCGHLRPGSGSKGKRYYCADILDSGGNSPTLVVAKAGNKTVAVTRNEVTIGDFNKFCQTTGQCSPLNGSSKLPASNISFEQIKHYVSWLSQQSGYQYRLPSYDEWLDLASDERNGSDPDRNCYIKFGTLQKGAELVNANVGKANDNGLVNHVGNVQELTIGTNGRLIAAGGSRKDPLKRCLVTTQVAHNGQPDSITGFRLIRTIK
ncbi:protein kinase [Sansalvadorimonas sp. 2012CJ34-2]|uniref:Protein kinase n=1 Tax=Parendozoicomonas callyspongiae TaxID=2942213 RepID=A0ABT0PD96_9GAMM|nr:bifunctional serine/threonine-protein kinase/formylglycine-generating enzyme family protein [Sansalvadorimonas sp. 2012CJ34-2]MCL6269349.1 protein kinase [Sansalvadorimonas sp. 2012CJ34-2]